MCSSDLEEKVADMSIRELRRLGAEHGVANYSRLKRGDLVAAIRDAVDAKSEKAPAKKKTAKKTRSKATKAKPKQEAKPEKKGKAKKEPKEPKQPKLPAKEVATSLKKALSEGHLEAAKKIADGWIAHARAQEKLALKRKELNQQSMEANAALRAAIERMGEARGESDLDMREASSDVLFAYQSILEVEAGRKKDLHELISATRDAKKKMDKAAKD